MEFLAKTPPDSAVCGCAEYIIYQEGDNICAVNCDTGKIDFQGTNATSVIQSAIDNLSYGKIFIKSGEYTIENAIKIKSNMEIVGEENATVLKAGKNLNKNILENYTRTSALDKNITIRNLKIDGNKNNQTSGNGIDMKGVAYINIEKVFIDLVKEDGIKIQGI